MSDVVTEGAASVAGEELRQFVERYERLEAEKKDIADERSDGRGQGPGL